MPEHSLTKADVLAEIAALSHEAREFFYVKPSAGRRLAALAAAVERACWRQEGHEPKQHGERACRHCGQRRADGTEGGR